MFVTLHTNVIVVTIRISIADLIGGAATQTFAPGLAPPLIVYTLTAALVDYCLMCIKTGFDGFSKKFPKWPHKLP